MGYSDFKIFKSKFLRIPGILALISLQIVFGANSYAEVKVNLPNTFVIKKLVEKDLVENPEILASITAGALRGLNTNDKIKKHLGLDKKRKNINAKPGSNTGVPEISRSGRKISIKFKSEAIVIEPIDPSKNQIRVNGVDWVYEPRLTFNQNVKILIARINSKKGSPKKSSSINDLIIPDAKAAPGSGIGVRGATWAVNTGQKFLSRRGYVLEGNPGTQTATKATAGVGSIGEAFTASNAIIAESTTASTSTKIVSGTLATIVGGTEFLVGRGISSLANVVRQAPQAGLNFIKWVGSGLGGAVLWGSGTVVFTDIMRDGEILRCFTFFGARSVDQKDQCIEAPSGMQEMAGIPAENTRKSVKIELTDCGFGEKSRPMIFSAAGRNAKNELVERKVTRFGIVNGKRYPIKVEELHYKILEDGTREPKMENPIVYTFAKVGQEKGFVLDAVDLHPEDPELQFDRVNLTDSGNKGTKARKIWPEYNEGPPDLIKKALDLCDNIKALDEAEAPVAEDEPTAEKANEQATEEAEKKGAKSQQ